ncbi:glycosyltransferase [Clostridium sp. MB40-C1]|uniref:glycosyltransferase n=1 Tax=Clostridium sp. MB40-C1 TaxID=3070996 RepID=UPI0027DECCBC|nr:nucleotide disphospho-sugar-binding domain-containing protein [Clostridium sp. MB40-C1]WMJ80652.1 glycosyltransferase [Clostridium sp. MB40-C1]
MANIIITTHWSDGDVLPFLHIGKYLKKKGHDITIFTHCCYEKRIKEEGINFVPWDNWNECENLFNDLVSCSDIVASNEEIQVFRDKYESTSVRIKEYQLLKPYCERKDTILLAKSRSSVAALLIAEKLKIPLIWVYMNPYEYESSKSFNSLNREKLCKEANELRKKMGLKSIESWFSWQCCPKGKIGLWPNWYKSDMVNEPEDINLVGFPLEPLNRRKNLSISTTLKDILLENPGPIIISGGSSKKIKKEFYKIAIKSCANLGRNVIVATKYKELLPYIIPSNVYVFDYIPLYESLAYASLIIHHGGIGTVSNAINAGVPQLVLADCLDRPLNGSIVKKIGLGNYLPPLMWNEENLIKSINNLLSSDYKKKCTRFVEEHKEENTFENISKIIESVKENEEYLINYETIKVCSRKINHDVNDKKEKNNNLNSLPKDMKKYLLEKIKKEKILNKVERG